MSIFGKKKSSKKSKHADTALLRGMTKKDHWTLVPVGSGKKGSENYGLKPRKVSRKVGLGLKKRYGGTERRDQYGSYGYTAKLPRKLFRA